MELHVMYFDPSFPPLKRIFVGDWIDLRTREDVVMECGTYRNIPLNVAIKLPDGYEAIMAPRSSTFKNFGILMANGIGVIDETYCGDDDEWQFPAYALNIPGHRDRVWIPKGMRIAQFRIIEHQPIFDIRTVVSHGEKNRGGFGTTGTF